MKQKKDLSKQSPKFRYNSTENIINFSVYLSLIIYLLYLCYNSAKINPPAHLLDSWLTPIIGLKRDGHDLQWEAYRSNLLITIAVAFAFSFIQKKIEGQNPLNRNSKSWIFGGIFICYVFRADTVFYMAIILAWYFYTIYCLRFRYFTASLWIIILTTLYLNQKYDHFRFISNQFDSIIPDSCDFLKSRYRAIHCSQFLNMTFLKLYSFSVDKVRGKQEQEMTSHVKECLACSESKKGYQDRQSSSEEMAALSEGQVVAKKQRCLQGRNYFELSEEDYRVIPFLNYILFAPTLLTGPPLSYKNFHSFKKIPTKVKPSYAYTFFIILSLEVFLHLFPAINLNDTHNLIEAEAISMMQVIFIWFKFLVIWKVGRMWSLMHGVDVVDNLSRCAFNNYGFQGFWRMWHSGFNQWLIRYLYIPLGGNQNKYAVVVVFLFTAFWHDHKLTILVWALLIIIMILPEKIVKSYFQKNHANLYAQNWFKYGSGFIAGMYLYMIVVVNAIGFGYGLEKAYILWEKMQDQWIEVIITVLMLMCGCVWMFYRMDLQGNTNKN